MAAKRFHVARPDQLQTLVKYAKTNATTVARTARIWKAAKDKRGETRWDRGIYACFSGDMDRVAALFRYCDGDMVEFGRLKYNLAMAWCERNLRRVYE